MCFVQGANLEHVGVVPAFLEREWEKMNFSLQSKLNNHSLSL